MGSWDRLSSWSFADISQLGLHRICNPDPEKFAVSLHRMLNAYLWMFGTPANHHLVYTPPHAANFGCHIYNEKTGKASHIKGNVFFSLAGQKL